YFDELYKGKETTIVALTGKEGNLVKIDENNNLSDKGNYIVSLLPSANENATDLDDFNDTVAKVKNGEKVLVELVASHAGHFNFLGNTKVNNKIVQC
ncbi:MAG: hypothetical protein IPQ19_13395, partial [Bacteroidetes bacterium]|nr:hypothetical protein [Bacteroidota bacterium]